MIVPLIDTFKSHYGTDDLFAACRSAVRSHFPGLEYSIRAIDVMQLLRLKNIELHEADGVEFDGRLVMEPGKRARISVSRQAGTTRRRFTIAHELGHWMIRTALKHPTASTETMYRGGHKSQIAVADEEKLANLLAAEMLLPFDAIVLLTKNRVTTTGLVRELAREFGTSRMAVLRRIVDVTRRNLLCLSVVPLRFRDLSSLAELDQAIIALPGDFVVDRSATRLVSRVRYIDLTKSMFSQLTVRTSLGDVTSDFSVESRVHPVPHTNMIAEFSFDSASQCSIRN